jgi:hypothetical protein
VYDPSVTFTILSGRWVGNTGCPAKSSTKGGQPRKRIWQETVLHVTHLPRIKQVRKIDEIKENYVSCKKPLGWKVQFSVVTSCTGKLQRRTGEPPRTYSVTALSRTDSDGMFRIMILVGGLFSG